jgi:sulfate/thiosulfate transport system permease protein
MAINFDPLPQHSPVQQSPEGAPTEAKSRSWVKPVLIIGVTLYLFLVLFIPAANVFIEAFSGGIDRFFSTFTERSFLQAVKLTLLMAVVAVPLNTFFGLCAAWAIARRRFPGRALLISIIDLPFSISPVVAGLMIVLLYGRNGWFGPILEANDIKVIFALPGMILATSFVTMPFIAREVLPVLEEFGAEQEEAAKILGASEWQTFRRVTLPSIRLSLLYGLILTNARAMGEFGAIAVVSGSIAGKTQTLPLFIEDAYKQYHTESSYSAAVLLACLAVLTIILKEILERKTRVKQQD